MYVCMYVYMYVCIDVYMYVYLCTLFTLVFILQRSWFNGGVVVVYYSVSTVAILARAITTVRFSHPPTPFSFLVKSLRIV